MKYWLMKSEPDEFGIEDLKRRPGRTEPWDGVRNYQARNFMRDEMAVGDRVFFYHSNCKQPGIVGIMKVIREAYPDHTAFDPDDPHFDPKSNPGKPRWDMVDVAFVERFTGTIGLAEMRAVKGLQEMLVLRKGNRLSITPVSRQEWNTVVRMSKTKHGARS
ncbi:MAG: EVE domain-containing protein [Proteobacteria bacterium]|nr:EVE domain-containing protein [Pseudomonadota bacterium]